MFSFVKVGEGPADRGQYNLMFNDERIATYVYWAFAGCGSAIITNLSNHYGGDPHFFWNGKERIDQLVKFLSESNPTGGGGHNAQEFYMLLSSSQYDYGSFKAFKSHPNVKLIDKYKKKPYGGTPLYLYRLSIQKDFDGLDKKKIKTPV